MVKKQISFADTDARIMGKKGDFDYRYNAQISVDADFQIIVGQHISLNSSAVNKMSYEMTDQLRPALPAFGFAGDHLVM